MQIILHIGTWKTGSSAVQVFMARNADLLAQQGVFLSSMVHEENGHTLLFRYATCKGPEREALVAELQAIAERHPDGRVIISSEHFWPLSADEIEDLAATLHRVSNDVRVLVYLRPQDEMWGSMYAQQAKTFQVTPDAPVWGTGDFVSRAMLEWALCYDKCLSMFVKAFGEGSVTPRIYKRSNFIAGDVVLDFLAFAGVENDPGFDRYEGDTNPSFGWKSVALSLWFVDVAYPQMRKVNALPDIRRMFRAAIGDMFARRRDAHWLGAAAEVLSGEDRREIRAHYQVDNQRLFDRYFGGEDVFGPPGDTTKAPLNHTELSPFEFNRARMRLMAQCRLAGLDMAGTEPAFVTPSALSVQSMRHSLSDFVARWG